VAAPVDGDEVTADEQVIEGDEDDDDDEEEEEEDEEDEDEDDEVGDPIIAGLIKEENN
jgi:segregation and condensation protein B